MRPFAFRMMVLAMGLTMATASAQVTPLMRYNTLSESLYVLERCGALTAERRTWLEKLRGDASLLVDWTAQERTAHDANLRAEFNDYYKVVEKEHCSELAQSTDHERKTLSR